MALQPSFRTLVDAHVHSCGHSCPPVKIVNFVFTNVGAQKPTCDANVARPHVWERLVALPQTRGVTLQVYKIYSLRRVKYQVNIFYIF